MNKITPKLKPAPAAASTAPRGPALDPASRPATAAVRRAPVLSSEESAVATMLARDPYLREKHVFLLRQIMVQYAVVAVLALSVVLLAMRPVQNHYFVEDQDGRITPVVPIDQPMLSLGAVTNWTTNAVLMAYNFGFTNYVRQLSLAEENFTQSGRLGFEKALKDSGELDSIKQYKYDVTGVIRGAPVLLNQVMIQGHYGWVFQIPLAVTYQTSADRNPTRNLMATVTVVRVPVTENPAGVAIQSMILQ